MLFHTSTFFVFFLIFLLGLNVFKGNSRLVYTSLASIVFYAWLNPVYVFVLLGLVAYGYIFTRGKFLQFPTLIVVLIGLLPLAGFKYLGFALENLSLFGITQYSQTTDWPLPLGISFITFSVIALVLDTRAGTAPKVKSIWETTLFVSFFPQLIAGPILRAHELIPQLPAIKFNAKALKPALLLFAIGAAKKVGIADQIAPSIDHIYANLESANVADIAIGFYGFAVQIYCDFSGYTDMAIALAMVLSVDLPINFDRPYLAKSVREFWRRWHITLSRWLRDYLYFKLGGSHFGLLTTVMALLLTMTIGGLWHGAAWTFVIWGFLHGGLLIMEHIFVRFFSQSKIVPDAIKIFIVFHVICLLWVFFRSENFDQVLLFIQPNIGSAGIKGSLINDFVPFAIVLVLMLHRWDNVSKVTAWGNRVSGAVIYPLSIMTILISAALSTNNPSSFIYFDF